MEIPTKPSPFTVGVDLGTTNSVIAVWDDNQSKVVVLSAGGQRIMPSVVSFEKNGDAVSRSVGTEAKNRAVAFPDETVVSVKDHMGSGKRFEIFGEDYTSENIASFILTELRRRAQLSEVDWWGPLKKEEGVDVSIQQAIITVPANFDPAQIRGTVEAAQQAGFDRFVDTLKEPVAAALAYGAQRVHGKKRLLVYDFGGGTFDVAIIEVDIDPEVGFAGKGGLEPKCYGGDNDLGGNNIDELLAKFLNEEFMKQNETSIDLLDLDVDDGVSRKMKRRAQQNLYQLSESTKIELAMQETKEISTTMIKDETGTPLTLNLTVTREQFEQMVEPLINRTIEVVKRTIAEAGNEKEDIDDVILVGGSSSLPIVRTKLKEFFGKDPFAAVDTATIVAEGAAIWGHLVQTLGVKRLPDVAPYTIGLLVEGEKFAPLIEKGTAIDPEKGYECPRQTFYNQVDNIPQIRVEVYKQVGEGRFVWETHTNAAGEEVPAFVKIGRFLIDDLPPRPAGNIRVDVTCTISPSGELNVTADFEGQPWPRDGKSIEGWY